MSVLQSAFKMAMVHNQYPFSSIAMIDQPISPPGADLLCVEYECSPSPFSVEIMSGGCPCYSQYSVAMGWAQHQVAKASCNHEYRVLSIESLLRSKQH